MAELSISGFPASASDAVKALTYDSIDISEITATDITGTLDFGDGITGRVEIEGTFSYDDGGLTGGTVTRAWAVVESWIALIILEDINLDAMTFATAATADFAELLFTGDDSIQSRLPSGDTWTTLGGDDGIAVGGGDDFVDGGDGTDTFYVSNRFAPADIALSGGDVVVDAAGHDTLRNIEFLEYRNLRVGVLTVSLTVGSTGHDELTGDPTSVAMKDFIFGRGGRDLIRGGGENDWLFGNGRADVLAGNEGDDRLRGGLGDDVLIGNLGNDRMLGQRGDDTLKAGLGDDRLRGGLGDDSLTGGGGSDVFVFATGDGSDTISDFEIGSDRIEIIDGAAGIEDLSLVQAGEDVILSFADVTLRVESVTVAALHDPGNFLF